MHDSPAFQIFLSFIAVAAVGSAIRRRAFADWLPAGFFVSFVLNSRLHQTLLLHTSLVFAALWVLAAMLRCFRLFRAASANSSLKGNQRV